MAQAGGGDIVFMIGADVAGLTSAGQSGEKSLADMERAAKALERQIDKIGEAGVAFQREMNKLTGVTREVERSARDSAAAFEAFDRSRAQVDNLRASIDPLFAASKRYEAALRQLDGALEMGTISAREHAQMMDMLAASYLRVDSAADMAAAGSRGMGGSIQQIGFQGQDFAVQVGAGTSATQAFAQQFPQLASAFGPVGVAVGTLAAIGLPLLATAFFNSKEQASAFAAAMQGVAESTVSARDELYMLQNGLDTLEQVRLSRELYALIVEQQRLRDEAVQAEGVVAQYLIDQADAMQGQIDAARARLAEDKKIRAEIEAIRVKEEQRKAAMEAANVVAEKMSEIMGRLSNADISGPWNTVLGKIQAAIDKAAEYARTAGFGMSTGSSDWAKNSLGFTLPGGELLPGQDAAAGGGGGGGGGGGKNPIETQLEALRQQLMTEEQLEIESYLRRQETLQQALDQRLITQQEYAALMEAENEKHQSKMADIDVMRYGTVLDKAEAFMGGMATVLQAGGQKQQRIASIFAAAQALISTYQGAAKELEKGTFGFASAAAVIAKGMGFVAAIRSAGGSGAGGTSGGRGGSAVSSGASSAPASPLDVRLTGIGAGDLFSGAQLSSLLDRLSAEAGDRGYRLMVA